jgi:hypothetical protein
MADVAPMSKETLHIGPISITYDMIGLATVWLGLIDILVWQRRRLLERAVPRQEAT